MEFLTANTKSLLDSNLDDGRYISAKDKRVIVIGGGDTGADCIGTALRHGCASLVNFELLDSRPRSARPTIRGRLWPKILRTDYAHEESIARFGADPRNYAVVVEGVSANGDGASRRGEDRARRVADDDDGAPKMVELAGTARRSRPTSCCSRWASSVPRLTSRRQLGVELDARSNYKAEHGRFATSVPGVFAAGDCRRGQSLVVWAINEGRGAARAVDEFLMGSGCCPRRSSAWAAQRADA